jgi:CheY-like chemotaxis protein
MSRSILLADDSLTIQKVVELTFMEGGYEVTSVGSGDEALVRLAEMTPHIVIADVHLPGADGYEICRSAKQRHPGVPVLLLVGSFEPFEEESVQECGADGHLKKPFDSQELLRRVEGLLAGAPTVGQSSESAAEQPWPELEQEPEGSGGVEVQTDFEAGVAVEVEPPPESIDEEEEWQVVGGDSELAAERVEQEASAAGLSDEDIERIARRVVELIGDEVVREISWDVIPDLAEIVIKDRIRELESQVE